MRIRYIKPGFWANEVLARIEPIPWPKLTFAGLWNLSDREGRLKDSPRWIHGQLFPYNEGVDVEVCLVGLAGAGFILRYEAHRERFIAIPKWLLHQRPHSKESRSIIPAPNRKKLSVKMQSPSLGSAEPDKDAPSLDGLVGPSRLGMGNGERGTGNENGDLNGDGDEDGKVAPSALAPVWRKPSPRVVPIGGNDHRHCDADAAAACGRGYCVPAFLVKQWRAQTGAEYVRTFTAEIVAATPDGPIGDQLPFWRGKWHERHGASSNKPTRIDDSIATGRRILAELESKS